MISFNVNPSFASFLESLRETIKYLQDTLIILGKKETHPGLRVHQTWSRTNLPVWFPFVGQFC